MEIISFLFCIGNNFLGIRLRYRNYGDVSFCYDFVLRKIYFISFFKYGEGLGNVCIGVVMENNIIIVVGEVSVFKFFR